MAFVTNEVALFGKSPSVDTSTDGCLDNDYSLDTVRSLMPLFGWWADDGPE